MILGTNFDIQLASQKWLGFSLYYFGFDTLFPCRLIDTAVRC